MSKLRVIQTVDGGRVLTNDGGHVEKSVSTKLPKQTKIPEAIIADCTNKQMSKKKIFDIKKRIISNERTITKEEYQQYAWNEKIVSKRNRGVQRFWSAERQRVKNNEVPTRQWTSEQIQCLLDKNSKNPRSGSGKPFQVHHTYSVSKYPHLSDNANIMYPATFEEHKNSWHGGNYKNSLPGKRINKT